jgi:hypothetical protein
VLFFNRPDEFLEHIMCARLVERYEPAAAYTRSASVADSFANEPATSGTIEIRPSDKT